LFLSEKLTLNYVFMLKNKRDKKAFILILTLLTMAIILLIGLGVFSIVSREIRISSLGYESQMALYAADSGIECIFYWDIKRQAISTTTNSNITCAGQNLTLVTPTYLNPVYINFTNGACAKVIVDQRNWPTIRVDSSGYNVGCNADTPKKVERGMRAIY
jgi:Tfp pilus assembly protein PilX